MEHIKFIISMPGSNYFTDPMLPKSTDVVAFKNGGFGEAVALHTFLLFNELYRYIMIVSYEIY
jgi:hypothetical protein